MNKKYANISVDRELRNKLKILAAKKYLSLRLLIQQMYENYEGVRQVPRK